MELLLRGRVFNGNRSERVLQLCRSNAWPLKTSHAASISPRRGVGFIQ
jgi:hypothetical protein